VVRDHSCVRTPTGTPTTNPRSTATGRLILGLLAIAASGFDSGAARAVAPRLLRRLPDDATLRHLETAGLAPLLHWALGDEAARLPADRQEALLAGTLSARARHRALELTTGEVIEISHALDAPVALLKGMSIAQRHYPSPHLRPMGDVDVLVSPRDRPRLQRALRQRGFMAMAGDWRGAAHAAPLCHPHRDAWVEVHDALFPADAVPLRAAPFTAESVAAHLVPFSFAGLQAWRLSDELALVHTACAWVRDLSTHAMHPSFVIPLLDAACLAGQSRDPVDWRVIDALTENETAAASLYLLLCFLERHGLAGPAKAALPRIAARQRRVRSVETAILLTMLDRWLIDGRPSPIGRRTCFVWATLLERDAAIGKLAGLPWKVLFPPDVGDRFSARHIVRLGKALAAVTNGRRPD